MRSTVKYNTVKDRLKLLAPDLISSLKTNTIDRLGAYDDPNLRRCLPEDTSINEVVEKILSICKEHPEFLQIFDEATINYGHEFSCFFCLASEFENFVAAWKDDAYCFSEKNFPIEMKNNLNLSMKFAFFTYWFYNEGDKLSVRYEWNLHIERELRKRHENYSLAFYDYLFPPENFRRNGFSLSAAHPKLGEFHLSDEATAWQKKLYQKKIALIIQKIRSDMAKFTTEYRGELNYKALQKIINEFAPQGYLMRQVLRPIKGKLIKPIECEKDRLIDELKKRNHQSSDENNSINKKIEILETILHKGLSVEERKADAFINLNQAWKNFTKNAGINIGAYPTNEKELLEQIDTYQKNNPIPERIKTLHQQFLEFYLACQRQPSLLEERHKELQGLQQHLKDQGYQSPILGKKISDLSREDEHWLLINTGEFHPNRIAIEKINEEYYKHHVFSINQAVELFIVELDSHLMIEEPTCSLHKYTKIQAVSRLGKRLASTLSYLESNCDIKNNRNPYKIIGKKLLIALLVLPPFSFLLLIPKYRHWWWGELTKSHHQNVTKNMHSYWCNTLLPNSIKHCEHHLTPYPAFGPEN